MFRYFFWFILPLFGVHLLHPVYAEPIPELVQSLKEELTRLNGAVIQEENQSASQEQEDVSSSQSQDWFFRDFCIRVRPNVGFEVPGIVSFKIVPEIEFVWQRDYPEGVVLPPPGPPSGPLPPDEHETRID